MRLSHGVMFLINLELVLSVYSKDRLGMIPLSGGRKEVENAVSYALLINISHCSTNLLRIPSLNDGIMNFGLEKHWCK